MQFFLHTLIEEMDFPIWGPPTSGGFPTRLTRLSLDAPKAWGSQRLRGPQGSGAPTALGPQSWGVPKACQLRILSIG
jgi:hypothetical protein